MYRFAAGTILWLTAFLAACSQGEAPAEAPQLEDSQACPVRTEPSAMAAEPSAAPETPYLQSPEEARAHDLALAAEARGWTLEQAEAYDRANRAMDPIASRLAAERPDVFVGGALAEEPGQPPKVYIKGPADETVRDIVAAAEIEIDIVDNQPYSRAELDDRQMRVFNLVREIGFDNMGAGSDITNRGQIEVDVVRQAGLPDDPDEILASLPAELRDGVTITVTDAPTDACDDWWTGDREES